MAHQGELEPGGDLVIPQRDIITWREHAPWPEDTQVEQDLLLTRAMVAIFSDPFLSEQVAMRGGTVLHKVHLAPAARYSEDIDLVLVGDRYCSAIRGATCSIFGGRSPRRLPRPPIVLIRNEPSLHSRTTCNVKDPSSPLPSMRRNWRRRGKAEVSLRHGHHAPNGSASLRNGCCRPCRYRAIAHAS